MTRATFTSIALTSAVVIASACNTVSDEPLGSQTLALEACSMLNYGGSIVARGGIGPGLGLFPAPAESYADLTKIANVQIQAHASVNSDFYGDGEYIGVPVADNFCVLAGLTSGGAEYDGGSPLDIKLELYPDSNGSYIDYRVRITTAELAEVSRVWVECWAYDQV